MKKFLELLKGLALIEIKKIVFFIQDKLFFCILENTMVYGQTAYNTRYTLRRLSAARVPQKCSRAYALCAFLLHHIFLFAKNATHFSYRKQKNVVYLFALNAIRPFFVLVILDIDRNE
jgi:hypothetical protein